jgi:hypothetical protein
MLIPFVPRIQGTVCLDRVKENLGQDQRREQSAAANPCRKRGDLIVLFEYAGCIAMRPKARCPLALPLKLSVPGALSDCNRFTIRSCFECCEPKHCFDFSYIAETREASTTSRKCATHELLLPSPRYSGEKGWG